VADVATAAFPRGRRSLIGRLAAAAGDGRARKAAAAVVAAAREHLPTLAAFAAVDYGAFQAAAAAGWIVTGVTVLLLDWKVRG
jgi:hypothetical protein